MPRLRSSSLSFFLISFNDVFPNIDELKKLCENPVAYVYRHADGLQSTMLLMSGLVQDFNFAARLAGQDKPLSTQMYLPMPPARATLASFFSPQVNNVERMFLTETPSYPVERTLLTTGLTAAAVDSVDKDGKRLKTPHLARVTYQPSPESTFWRT